MLVAGVLAVPAVAQVSTPWQVTNTMDPGDPVCNPSDCSLRAAIAAANVGSGSDTVEVPAGEYTLDGTELDVNAGMQIVGAGESSTIINAHGASRILLIAKGAGAVTVSGVTLENGKVAGGGGAIRTTAPAPLTLSDDLITGNTSLGEPGDGAVSISTVGQTTVTVTGSTFTDNAAGGPGTATDGSGVGNGGAISFDAKPGALNVAGSSFSKNTAGGNGGAGVSSGQGEGGAIFASGEIVVSISTSVFHANQAGGNGGAGLSSAEASGGAVDFAGESLTSSFTVAASTFESNEAGGSAGVGGGSGEGFGGGAEAGGEGAASFIDDTFLGNNANQGEGGALSTELPTTLVNDTLTGNAATKGRGGNLAVTEDTTTLKNTILAEGAAPTGANCYSVGGTLTSLGHNLEDTTPSECGLTAAGDKVGTPPLLAGLHDNGGPVPTEALEPESPAIDAGDDVGCPASDARGVLRPAGAACDIGAFEVATPAAGTLAASTVTSISAQLDSTVTNPDIAAGTVFFQYGTTTAYGSQSSPQALGADTLGAPFNTIALGLAPETTYHFRIVVTNGVGTVTGVDQTFKTLPPAPILSRLALKPASMRAQLGKGSSVSSKSSPRGTVVSYGDTQAATTNFVVSRQVLGFKVGRTCATHRPSKHGAHLHRCTKFVLIGSFSRHDAAGGNRFRFTGRVAGNPLRTGRYRVQALARNVAGESSNTLTLSFSVVH
jgi:hypothetical protein